MTTEHNPYQWYEDLETAVKRKHEQQGIEFRRYLHEQTTLSPEDLKITSETQKVLSKIGQRYAEENENEKARLIAQAKDEAAAKAEEEANKKFGTKSKKELEENEILKQMVKDLF